MQDGIRRGLGYAMQWYDMARLAIEDRLDSAVRTRAQATLEKSSTSRETIAAIDSRPQEGQDRRLPDQCAELLQKRCPACFGGNVFGRPLSE